MERRVTITIDYDVWIMLYKLKYSLELPSYSEVLRIYLGGKK